MSIVYTLLIAAAVVMVSRWGARRSIIADGFGTFFVWLFVLLVVGVLLVMVWKPVAPLAGVLLMVPVIVGMGVTAVALPSSVPTSVFVRRWFPRRGVVSSLAAVDAENKRLSTLYGVSYTPLQDAVRIVESCSSRKEFESVWMLMPDSFKEGCIWISYVLPYHTYNVCLGSDEGIPPDWRVAELRRVVPSPPSDRPLKVVLSFTSLSDNPCHKCYAPPKTYALDK